MDLTKTILLSVQLVLIPFISSAAHADNSGFAPDNAQFPPQLNMNSAPSKTFQAPQVQGYGMPYPVQQPSFQQPTFQQQPRNIQQYSQYGNQVPRNNQNNNVMQNPGNFPSNSMPFSNNMMPFGNSSNNGFNPFSNGNMPFSNNNGMMPTNPMNNMFGNNNNSTMPFFPNTNNSNRKKAWGTERNIWPDFYTDFTDEAWDKGMSAPRDLGTMPGGWRFPYISMPDPVTVSDAITNQFPPIAEEAGKMADFSDWGVFD